MPYIDPKSIILTDVEQAYEKAIVDGVYKNSSDISALQSKHAKIAKKTMKRVPLTIRPYEKDIVLLKSIAMQEGIPYQTKLISIIHTYVNNYS